MSSTRSKNTEGNYNLQQRQYGESRNYTSYEYGYAGRAYCPALPCVGITPSHMARENFSFNSVDIESSLYGINSTNLVDPQAPVVPELKTLPSVSYFDRMPLIMPKQFNLLENQRPFPIPN
jgi:hypothetical protein